MNDRRARALVWGCLTTALLLGGCAQSPKPRTVQPVLRDVPQALRGTIGTEVEFRGIEPVLVSGLGLVVGLNGTGGDTLPDNIAATMEREMGLRGIAGSNEDGSAISRKSPRELLRDKNVAVVLVQAAIPPGAPANATFDVYVQGINATSLEGGTLWTTDLRIGEANTFGAVQARRIATARGPVFINPFAEPGKEEAGVTRTSGRILDGGQVTNPLGIEMVLQSAGFGRARAIVSAINSRFPQGPGDPVQTARGRSGGDIKTGVGGSIELHVPNRYRQTPSDFLNLIKHLQIDQAFPEQYARRYVDALKAEPALGDELSWCLEALGQRGLPIMRELYDYPELIPQIAALKAGARLDDGLAAPHLKELAKHAQGGIKTQAISFLGLIDEGPTVDQALSELLNEKELDVRVAAYEALAKRAESRQLALYQNYQQQNPDAPRYSPTRLQILAARSLPSHTIQGIERTVVSDKFFLDTVAGGDPMIYISQQGQPRIVLFGDTGEGVDLVRPMVVSAWSNRLMLSTDAATDMVRIYYRPANLDRPTTQSVKANLPKLIEFMARKTTAADPRPGLDLTYSEVVGALSALQSGGGTKATFATEQDRLRAQILGAKSSREILERPESPEDRNLVVLHQPKAESPAPNPTHEGPHIVPIAPPDKKK